VRRVAITVLFLVLLASPAGAVSLQFTTPIAGGYPGLVRADMWLSLPSREEDLRALRFDIDVSQPLMFGFHLPNALRFDESGNEPFFTVPFDVHQEIMDPDGPVDVRVDLEAAKPFDLNELAALAAAYPACVGTACARQEAGQALDYLYLGSFIVSYPGYGGVFLKVSEISGEADGDPYNGIDPLIAELSRSVISGPSCADPRGCRLQGLYETDELPEPRVLAVLGLIAALLAQRRLKTGLRFWAKASGPSLESSLAKTARP
jgi:hypothetical protein